MQRKMIYMKKKNKVRPMTKKNLILIKMRMRKMNKKSGHLNKSG
jgi:hypothetical protein